MVDLYVKSMGKLLKVRKVCQSENEANKFCANHKDVGVIAVDNGLIYVADFYQIAVPSQLIKDKP